MYSNTLSTCVDLGIKFLSLAIGLLAAGFALYAARLWLKASKIELPFYAPPMTSIGDVPEHHIMGALAQINATADALRQSNSMNASAARWTALAALLTGLTAILGVL